MKASMRNYVRTIMVLGAAALASGCSGGQSTLPAAGQAHGVVTGSAKVKLSVKIPARKAGVASTAAKRSPQYVSASTTELAIRTGTSADIGAAAWQIFDISANAAACTTDATSLVRTCVVTVTAPAVQGALVEFQIVATDSTTIAADTQPTGNFLSTGDPKQTVTLGAANAVSASLTSVIGKLAVSGPAFSVWAAPGQSANVVVGIVANDIDGGAIFGQPASFANPITFSDGLTGSPFTYPSASTTSLGLTPPETPGPIQATIGYLAPAAPSVPAATVTVSTIIPDFLPPPPTPPSATFTLSPMVVSASDAATAGSGSAVGPLNLVTGSLKFVTVNESNAKSFTVSVAPVGQAEVTLENAAGNGPLGLSPLVPDVNGNAVFSVFAGVPTTAATAPTITVTDNSRTIATLPVTITAAALPAASAVRKAAHR